jgi:hypothetical protein
MNDIPIEVKVEWFYLFWTIYWRKVAKKDAFKAWLKIVRSEEIFSEIMDGLRLQYCHMMKRKPDFRPHAATWLNGYRWNDVLAYSGEFELLGTNFQARKEITEDGEYLTSPASPTVSAGPDADQWRRKNAR